MLTYLPTDPTHLPTYLPTYPLTHLPTYLPIYIPTYLPTYPPTYLPTYRPTYIPTDQLLPIHNRIHTYINLKSRNCKNSLLYIYKPPDITLS